MVITLGKYKILTILKVPPPITGATLSNMRLLNSIKINESFNFLHLKVSYASQVSNLGKLSIKKAIVFFLLIYKTILGLIRFKPDLVYFQISPKNIAFIRDFILVVILKLGRSKVVYHIRGIGINAVAQKNPILKCMYQFAFRDNYIISFSELVKNDVSIVYKGTPYLVPNGIRQSISEQQLAQSSHNDEDPIRILFVSNYLEAKGVFDLIEAARFISNRNFKIFMIGAIYDDLTYLKMKDKIKTYNLENYIELIGPKYNDEKSHYFLNSDIFVFPTHNEGFGNVALEAMEASLPIVAYSEGSLPYIIENNVTGFIISKKNIIALTEKINLLIVNRNLRTKMGMEGRKRFLQLFTIERFEENIIHTFNSILPHKK